MLEPRTRPRGRNPASRTSRNSFTDRSEVNRLVAWPGRISARRRMASSGMRVSAGAAGTGAPGGCAGGAGGKVGEGPGRCGPRGAERDDGGAEDRRLRDVVLVVLRRLDLPRVQAHRR